jgi:hypothetical protein
VALCFSLASVRGRFGLCLVLLACAASPSAAQAADPIMRLSDVQAGMGCTARSVIHGTAVSEFDVAIIDVLRGEPAVFGPRILIRVSGPAVDATGIGPGFSGSPVYCSDATGVRRVVGAISESVGQYGNHVALATPIEEVLGVAPLPPAKARNASALLRSAKPLATPLTVSGLSGPVRRAALAAGSRAGIPLATAPTGPVGDYPAYDLVPGTAVAAGLVSGDLTVSAIGTVTYRDGAKLWAFGHPLDGAGRRSLPLLDAYVFSIIDNPIGVEGATTYKLATAGRPVGALTNDGLGAIAGEIGPPPATIPLTVFARDLVSKRTRTIQARVADERQLGLGTELDLAAGFALSDAVISVLRAEPEQITTSVCVKVRVRQARRPLGFCGRYFDAFEMFSDVSQAMALVEGYQFGPLDIRSVSIRTGVRAGVREAFILDGKAPRRVRPGQRIRVGLELQRSRAGRFRVSFPYRVPSATKAGRRTLTVRGTGVGGFDLDDLFDLLFGGGGGQRPTRSVGELGLRIAALGTPEGIRATFARKGKGDVVYRSGQLKIRGKTRIPVVVRRAKRD